MLASLRDHLRNNILQTTLTIIAGLMGYLIVATVMEKGVQWVDKAIFIALGILLLLAYWKAQGRQSTTPNAVVGKSQKGLQLVGLLEIFGVMSAVVGLMAPRASTESEAGLIERTAISIFGLAKDIKSDTGQINDKIDDIGKGDQARNTQIEGGRFEIYLTLPCGGLAFERACSRASELYDHLDLSLPVYNPGFGGDETLLKLLPPVDSITWELSREDGAYLSLRADATESTDWRYNVNDLGIITLVIASEEIEVVRATGMEPALSELPGSKGNLEIPPYGDAIKHYYIIAPNNRYIEGPTDCGISSSEENASAQNHGFPKAAKIGIGSNKFGTHSDDDELGGHCGST